MSNASDYWRNNAELRHITPPGDRWPEGAYFPNFVCGKLSGDDVSELGCGDGRLSVCVSEDYYIGYDINPHAVTYARAHHPRHIFVDYISQEIVDQTILCHTVLLHVPDDEIGDVLSRLKCDRLIISEIMGRQYRVEQDKPPVFNRNKEEYVELAKAHGYELAEQVNLPYERYKDTHLTWLEFKR